MIDLPKDSGGAGGLERSILRAPARLLFPSSVDTPPMFSLPRHYTHTHRYRDTRALTTPTIPGPSIKTLVDFFLIWEKKKKK